MSSSSAIRLVPLLMLLAACTTKPPEVFEIPDGYRGWVEVRANRPQCPPLSHSGKTTVFVIPSNGRLCTSSPLAFGEGHEDFFYVKAGSRVPLPDSMIWQVETIGKTRLRFFVGPREEYEKSLDKAP